MLRLILVPDSNVEIQMDRYYAFKDYLTTNTYKPVFLRNFFIKEA